MRRVLATAILLALAACSGEIDTSDPKSTGSGAGSNLAKESSGEENGYEDTGLIEYAAVTASPGMGTYVQLGRRLKKIRGTGPKDPQYEFGRKVCHWCSKGRHLSSQPSESCTGKVYFGPPAPDQEFAYLPSLDFPCECSCTTPRK